VNFYAYVRNDPFSEIRAVCGAVTRLWELCSAERIGAVAGAGAGAVIGATAGAAAGTFVAPGLGTVAGGEVGLGGGALTGAYFGSAIGAGIGIGVGIDYCNGCDEPKVLPFPKVEPIPVPPPKDEDDCRMRLIQCLQFAKTDPRRSEECMNAYRDCLAQLKR
jgi:hypothetical protein